MIANKYIHVQFSLVFNMKNWFWLGSIGEGNGKTLVSVFPPEAQLHEIKLIGLTDAHERCEFEKLIS